MIFREQTKLPPLVGTNICGVAPGWVVVVKVNPKTVVTLFGVRRVSSLVLNINWLILLLT